MAFLNSQPGGAIAGSEVGAVALREYLRPGPALGGAPHAGPHAGPHAAPTPAPPPTPEQLAPYAGRYRIPSATVTVRPQGGGLLLTTEPTLVPGQVGPDVRTLMMPEMLEVQARLVGPDLALVTAEGLTCPSPSCAGRTAAWAEMSLSTRLIPRVGPA